MNQTVIDATALPPLFTRLSSLFCHPPSESKNPSEKYSKVNFLGRVRQFMRVSVSLLPTDRRNQIQDQSPCQQNSCFRIRRAGMIFVGSWANASWRRDRGREGGTPKGEQHELLQTLISSLFPFLLGQSILFPFHRWRGSSSLSTGCC